MAYTFNSKANNNINNAGNPTFGNIKQTNMAGDYITNKKAKLLFDINNNKKKHNVLSTQTDLLLLKQAQLLKNINFCPSLPSLDNTNLVSGLYSIENLNNVNIITSINDTSNCPIYSATTFNSKIR